MDFVEEELRREAGGVQGQDLFLEHLLYKAFCTIEVFSWPSKLLQRQLDFRRDFVTLFMIHPVGVCYVGNAALIHW